MAAERKIISLEAALGKKLLGREFKKIPWPR
jgi:hypothetical protein